MGRVLTIRRTGFLWIAVLLAAVTGCSRHFLTDKTFREQVEEDLAARAELFGDSWPSFYGTTGVEGEEREALDFLYAYMPLADVTDYPESFFLENVRSSFRTRREAGWEIPERIFRHFVLPVRVNNENLDSSRVVFCRELSPRIAGLSMEEAILEVNHWCHEKVTYQPSDARTTSPLNTVKNALGRCGEESTFTVAALRSVGIPARQVYTPRWAHTDDNHAWVEAWADGQWHFLGACEPEPVLDLGWFNAPASRAMLMHTKVFGRYDGPEEKVLESPNYTEINLIDNYARTARVDFTVLDASGKPVEDARVDFCIYNYAEFYPAVTKYTDADGRTFLSAGLGDLLVWASKDGAYGFSKVSFGRDAAVTVVLDGGQRRQVLTIVPPPETAVLPVVTEAQRVENDRRFAREDSLRQAYEATFFQADALADYTGVGGEYLLASRGNHPVIRQFLSEHPTPRALRLLSLLSGKDLRDITPENLADSYEAEDAVLNPRVEDEFLSPYKAFFRTVALRFTSPDDVLRWVRDSVRVYDDPKAWSIPMFPEGVYRSRLADPRSRDIFFVALSRSSGIEARKDPVTGKIQYRNPSAVPGGDEWLDVDFSGKTVAEAAPRGMLRLTYSPTRTVDNPKYYSHFTLSKVEGGRPRLLTFDEGEVDMGGGVDWQHVFREGTSLDTGRYLLVSGNRLSNGSVPVTLQFVEIREGETTVADLVIDEPDGAVPVMGSFDSESRFTPVRQEFSGDGEVLSGEKLEEQSLLSVTGRGYFVTAVLEPGKEPTNHVLRDLAAARSALEAWGRPILLLCTSEADLLRLQTEMAHGRYGVLPSTVRLGLDTGDIRSQLVRQMKLTSPGRLPLVVLSDTFNRVFFCSEGYTIGLGEQLAATIARL